MHCTAIFAWMLMCTTREIHYHLVVEIAFNFVYLFSDMFIHMQMKICTPPNTQTEHQHFVCVGMWVCELA